MSSSSKQYVLKDNTRIYHINDYETEYLYEEIFDSEVYLENMQGLPDNAIILDIGANIGLFSLYAKKLFPSCEIYAFEPAPETFNALIQNTVKYSDTIHCFQTAISNSNAKRIFYYYPGYSVISGMYADKDRDAAIITCGMQLEDNKVDAGIKLVKSRLNKIIPVTTDTITLSKIIENNSIPQIDLLKIDIEGSETEVLLGIQQHDWEKIKKITMEVHSKTNLDIICQILKDQDYEYTYIKDQHLGEANIYNLCASRR